MKHFMLLLLFVLTTGTSAAHARFPYSESKFLREFRTVKGIQALLDNNTKGKIDGILVLGPGEGVFANGDKIILHRAFEVEIDEISATNPLLENIESDLKRKMQSSGMKVKTESLGVVGFTLQYQTRCFAGFVDVRAVFVGDAYHLYFVFNETFCRRSVSK